MVCLAATETVRAQLDALKANECEVELDLDIGTATARDGDIVVYRAIQKGRGGPWIVRCTESDRIRWVR